MQIGICEGVGRGMGVGASGCITPQKYLTEIIAIGTLVTIALTEIHTIAPPHYR